MPKNSFSAAWAGSIYLIDDVSVVESDLPAYAGPDRHVGLGDSVYIGRPQEPGIDCQWRVLGSNTVIGDGTGVWVKPTTTTSYVVTQTLCGTVKKDTVRVEVWGVGVSGIKRQNAQQYGLSPNPGTGSIRIAQAIQRNVRVSLQVYNVLGAEVHSEQLSLFGKEAAVDLSALPGGVYTVLIREPEGATYKLRFMKK